MQVRDCHRKYRRYVLPAPTPVSTDATATTTQFPPLLGTQPGAYTEHYLSKALQPDLLHTVNKVGLTGASFVVFDALLPPSPLTQPTLSLPTQRLRYWEQDRLRAEHNPLRSRTTVRHELPRDGAEGSIPLINARWCQPTTDLRPPHHSHTRIL